MRTPLNRLCATSNVHDAMPIDTLLVYVGVYGDVADAEADYQLEQAMARAAKLEQKRIEADLAELERDAASVEQKIY